MSALRPLIADDSDSERAEDERDRNGSGEVKETEDEERREPIGEPAEEMRNVSWPPRS